MVAFSIWRRCRGQAAGLQACRTSARVDDRRFQPWKCQRSSFNRTVKIISAPSLAVPAALHAGSWKRVRHISDWRRHRIRD